MPGPRFARNLPTGVSAPREARSSTRLSPTRTAAASTPCSGTRSRCSSSAPKSRSYVSSASSRFSTARPRWWMPRGGTASMLTTRAQSAALRHRLRCRFRTCGLGPRVRLQRPVERPALPRPGGTACGAASGRAGFARASVCNDRSSGRLCLGGKSPHGSDRLARAGLGLDVGEEPLDLVADERLLLEQRRREAVERAAVLGQQADRLVVRLVGEPSLLLVAEALRLLRERVAVGAHRPRRDHLGHAELEHHLARQL